MSRNEAEDKTVPGRLPMEGPISELTDGVTQRLQSLFLEHIRPSDTEAIKSQIHDLLSTLDAAADTILSEVEKIQATGNDDPASLNHVKESCLSIVEACSFHDLSCQRLTEIVNRVDQLAVGLDTIQNALGCAASGDSKELHKPDPTITPEGRKAECEAGLLNGPALSGDGVDQEEVDRLMNFD